MKIALIAHDKKKDAMIELAVRYKDVLSQHLEPIWKPMTFICKQIS